METGRIPLSEPNLIGNARRYLDECIQTNFVSSVGPFVDRFEREFAQAVGAKYAVACASGTAALHVSMVLLGVGPGDEVMVSSLTFVASVNPIAYERATPILVDSEPESWNADPNLIVEELERRARAGEKQPKAVEVVHILGHPAQIEPVARACKRHGVVLIEDAAEALGATYRHGEHAGKHVGTVGLLGCFSFNGNKVITTGGGGMLVTDDLQLAKRAKHLTTQARVPGLAYKHDAIGFNYRLPNVNAALGVAQLEQLPAFLAAKKRLAAEYDRRLGETPGLSLPPRASWADPSMWLYSVQLEDAEPRWTRDAVLERLTTESIEARPIWTPVHTHPMYAQAPRLGTGAVSEGLAARALSLPSSVHLSAPQQDRVITTLLSCRH